VIHTEWLMINIYVICAIACDNSFFPNMFQIIQSILAILETLISGYMVEPHGSVRLIQSKGTAKKGAKAEIKYAYFIININNIHFI
jgi:hypothetical protein